MKTVLTDQTLSLAASVPPAFEHLHQCSDGMVSHRGQHVEAIDFAARDTDPTGSIDREDYEQHP